MTRRAIVLSVVLFVAYGCATTSQQPAPQLNEPMHGVASWYGQEFAGRTTANGEIFDPMLMTAAHRTLPYGTLVDVSNPKTGQTVRVRINDRGPFVGNRMIDLSYAAAQQISLIDPGSGEVDVKIITLGRGDREPPAPYVVQMTEPPAVNAPAPPPTPAAAPTVVEPTVTVENIKVEEVHGGVETRKQVAANGTTIESVPVVKPAAPAPAPVPPPVAAAPPPKPPRAVTPPPTPAGKYVVQVGAFSIEANAKELQRHLAGIGLTAYIDRTSLWRVRLGPFATKEQAIKARENLESAGISAIIVGN